MESTPNRKINVAHNALLTPVRRIGLSRNVTPTSVTTPKTQNISNRKINVAHDALLTPVRRIGLSRNVTPTSVTTPKTQNISNTKINEAHNALFTPVRRIGLSRNVTPTSVTTPKTQNINNCNSDKTTVTPKQNHTPNSSIQTNSKITPIRRMGLSQNCLSKNNSFTQNDSPKHSGSCVTSLNNVQKTNDTIDLNQSKPNLKRTIPIAEPKTDLDLDKKTTAKKQKLNKSNDKSINIEKQVVIKLERCNTKIKDKNNQETFIVNDTKENDSKKHVLENSNKSKEKQTKKTLTKKLSLKKSSSDSLSEIDLEPPLLVNDHDYLENESDILRIRELITDKQNVIKKKLEHLQGLLAGRNLKNTHKINELNNLTKLWKTASVAAIKDFHQVLLDQQIPIKMSCLLTKLQVPDNLIQYNEIDDVFS